MERDESISEDLDYSGMAFHELLVSRILLAVLGNGALGNSYNGTRVRMLHHVLVDLDLDISLGLSYEYCNRGQSLPTQ